MNESQVNLLKTASASIITIGISVALYHVQKKRNHVWDLSLKVWMINQYDK